MEKGLFWLLSAALISGVSIFLNKFAVSTASPVAFTFLKNAAVAVLFISLIIGLGGLKRLISLDGKTWMKLAVIGLIGGGIPFILFFKGLAITGAASASFIHKSLFVGVIILSAIFLKQMPSRRMVFASAALLAGNLFLLKVTNVQFGFGDLLVFLAAMLWAAEFVISKKLLENVRPMELAFGRMFFGSITILAYALAFEGGIPAAALGLNSLKWVCLTSLFLFAYVFAWYSGLSRSNPITAAVVLMLGSPVTTLLSVASGSPASLLQWLGFGLIIAGVVAYFPKLSLLQTPNAQ